jgi:hypothetical protein
MLSLEQDNCCSPTIVTVSIKLDELGIIYLLAMVVN